MKKTMISVGLSMMLCSSLQAFEYNIVDGNQMLGAVENMQDLSIFKNKCVNYVYYQDLANGGAYEVYNANWTLTGYTPLTKLDQGQGFIVNASGTCTVSTAVATDPNAFVFKGKTYSTVTSPNTGKIWLDRNIGASKVCDDVRSSFATDEAYTNSQKDCFGEYYQWGRNADGHQILNSLTRTTQLSYPTTSDRFVLNDSSAQQYDWSSSDLNGQSRSANWSKTDGTSVCPIGYRVPTFSEILAETSNFVAFHNALNLPKAGKRDRITGQARYLSGISGSIWSSTPTSVHNDRLTDAFYYSENSFNPNPHDEDRADALTIRCIKN